jgi:hypothetical protein
MAEKKRSKIFLVLMWVMGLGIVATIFANKQQGIEPGSESKVKTPEEISKQKQSSVDLAQAMMGIKLIRASQKDPDSFKLHGVGLTSAGSACIDFSGTNSFGGRIRNSAVISRDRKTALTTSDGSRFVSAWSKLCANQPQIDELSFTQRMLDR